MQGATATAPALTSGAPASQGVAAGSWSAPVTVGSNSTNLVLLGCAGKTFCLAFDQANMVYTFDGSQWGTGEGAPSTLNASALSCPTPTFCLVTYLQNQAWTWDGTKWWGPTALLSGQDQGYGIDAAIRPNVGLHRKLILPRGAEIDRAVACEDSQEKVSQASQSPP